MAEEQVVRILYTMEYASFDQIYEELKDKYTKKEVEKALLQDKIWSRKMGKKGIVYEIKR